ncbi:MAG: hypothetical protein M5T61_17375 [Acidimicrobiia bacterium]|nr:hypothetical protein [Acidimicrobiia bacterium]
MEARVGVPSSVVMITQGLVILLVAGSGFLLDQRGRVRVDAEEAPSPAHRSAPGDGRGRLMGPFDQATFSAAVLLTLPPPRRDRELFSERAGVLNVGLEGMILMGAFGAYWGQWWTGNLWLGMVAGAAAGVALAAVMALLLDHGPGRPVVVGVGLNLLALGLTTFSFREVFGDRGEIVLDRMGTVRIRSFRASPSSVRSSSRRPLPPISPGPSSR